MAGLKEILSWFEKNKYPTQEQFKESWTSFWHKSEKIPQSQILDLKDTLESAVRGLIYQDPVLTRTELSTRYPNPLPGWASLVQNEGYIYSWNENDWANTGLKAFPEDVVMKEELVQLVDDTDNKIYGNVFSISGGYIIASEPLKGNQGKHEETDCTPFIPILGKPEIKIKGRSNDAVFLIAFYDSKKNIISGISGSEYNDKEVIISSEEIPLNTSYIRATKTKGKKAYIRFNNLTVINQLMYDQSLSLQENDESINIIRQSVINKPIYVADNNELTNDFTRDSQRKVGFLIPRKSLFFNRVVNHIYARTDNNDVRVSVYLVDECNAHKIDLDVLTPEFTKVFSNKYEASPLIDFKTDSINCGNKYPLIVFECANKLAQIGYKRKINPTPIPDNGIYAKTYITFDAGSEILTKNRDTIRGLCPTLYFDYNQNEEIHKEENIITDNLKDEEYKKTVVVTNGVYAKPNSTYSLDFKQSSKMYFGVDFTIDEDINSSNGDKEIIAINNKNGDSLSISIRTQAISKFLQKQMLYSSSNIKDKLDFETEYPLPYFNSRFIAKTNINGVVKEYFWVNRNLREWQPICGENAFRLQYKPQVIRDGAKIYNNQELYNKNKNWYLEVNSSSLIIRNSELFKKFEFDFSVYKTVDKLFSAIEKETITGGLQDFIFEPLDQSLLNGSYRPSNSLLKCVVKLVDVYPYTGVGANADLTMYDAWSAFIPYWQDQSLHSIEIATIESKEDLFITIDGIPPMDDYTIENAKNIVNDSKCEVGTKTGLKTTFHNLEYYINTHNGYSVFKDYTRPAQTFIASKKNPRIVGIMWHDMIPSSIVGRPTTWADVPKYMREDFDKIGSWVGSDIVYHRDYNQFISEPILLESGEYSVKTIDGLEVAGKAIFKNDIVSKIEVTRIINGDWTTKKTDKHHEGIIIRVGNDVCHSTAMLEQVVHSLKERGYRYTKWIDIVDLVTGKKKSTSYKYFVPQFDDFGLYLYTNNDIRKVFDRNNIPISVALELNRVSDSNGVLDIKAKNACTQMKIQGHEVVIHTPPEGSSRFTDSVLSDEAYRNIITARNIASELNINANIWDQAQNQSTPNSLLLMKTLGINGCISTMNVSTVRATNKMFLSRTSLNYHHVLTEYPIY